MSVFQKNVHKIYQYFKKNDLFNIFELYIFKSNKHIIINYNRRTGVLKPVCIVGVRIYIQDPSLYLYFNDVVKYINIGG